MTDVDKVATMATTLAPVANWAISNDSVARKVIEPITGIHPEAELPKYVSKSQIFMSKTNKFFPLLI